MINFKLIAASKYIILLVTGNLKKIVSGFRIPDLSAAITGGHPDCPASRKNYLNNKSDGEKRKFIAL